jgi:CAP12/Pycsar effector protein, TIR domain
LTISGLFVSADVDLGRARRVFVVHGRNSAVRSAMFAFLRAIGLHPIEWSEAVKMTGSLQALRAMLGRRDAGQAVSGPHRRGVVRLACPGLA